MNSFIPSFLSCIFISSFIFIIHGVDGDGYFATSNLIQDSCRTASNDDPNINFNFCTTSLQSAPASQWASLRDLGRISIKLISNNVTDTRSFVKNLLKNTKIDAYTKECLSDCFQLYSDSISSLKQASDYYNSSRYYDANIQISSVMDGANTCEDGFKEKKGIVSPLTKRNNFTFELSAISLSLMRLIQERE